MLSDKASLDTRVSWIREETEQQLGKIKADLDAFATEQDSSLLQRVSDGLAETVKTMKMTGVQGGERLTHEMHALVQDLLADKVYDKSTSAVVLQKGVLQINEYLQHLQDGYADLPIVILPLLNELRAARGEELLSELLVFLPEDGAIGNNQIGTDQVVALSESKRGRIYEHLRMHFQQALLAWYKKAHTAKALHKIMTLSHDLITIHSTISVRVLWWLSKALAEALKDQRLEHGAAVKLVMGNLERLLPKLAVTDPSEHDNIPELDDLKKNLLYYIGMAEHGSPLADDVKQAYLLDVYLPQGETLEKLRKHYASPGQKLWRSVADTVNEDIESIIDGFTVIELNPDEGILQLIIDKSSRTATTLSMLGLGRLARIIEKQIKAFEQLKSNPYTFDQERRVQVATQWLRVKDILEEYAETGEDATEKLFSGEEDSYKVSGYSARKQVLKIIESKLNAASNELNEYALSQDPQKLKTANDSLKTVQNTIKFLNHREIFPLIDGGIAYLDRYAGDDPDIPDIKDVGKLAEVLATLEDVVIALRSNADYLARLKAGFDAILELHKKVGLYDGIEEEISDANEETQQLKKHQRQKKMEAILAH